MLFRHTKTFPAHDRNKMAFCGFLNTDFSSLHVEKVGVSHIAGWNCSLLVLRIYYLAWLNSSTAGNRLLASRPFSDK